MKARARALLFSLLVAWAAPARADVIEDCEPWEHRVSTGPPPSGLRGHAPYECRLGPGCAVDPGAGAGGAGWLVLAVAAAWLVRRSRR